MFPLEIKLLCIALICFAWFVVMFIVRGMRLHAWMMLVDALRHHDPESYTETGEPKYFLFQKIGRPNTLGNDRLHYQALRYPALFAQHPAIKSACEKYRTLALVEYASTGLIVLLALVILFIKSA